MRSAIIYFLSVSAFLAICVAAGSQEAMAQVTPDSTPGQKTSVDVAPNNVPIVNIETPNAAGVSHNKYTNFNVGSEGLIFNNSQGVGQSKLGGLILGNPNLQGGNASVILNEVTGGNISRLHGYMEVYGKAADVIVANPNGITCRGCGFINTPRATLSTGKAEFNAAGEFTGLRVEKGEVIINNGGQLGIGIDVRTVDYFDIVAQSILINGAIHGKEVGLFAGLNSFDYASRKVTAHSAGGSGYGIDSTALGGAYANRITLVGTEKGMSVKAPAEMRAAMGGITLTANGKIVFGKASAKGKIKAISTKSIEIAQNGSVWSETALELVTRRNANLNKAGTKDDPAITIPNSFVDGSGPAILKLQVGARVGAKGTVKIDADTLNLETNAVLASGMDENGQIARAEVLTIEATDLTNKGFIGSEDTINISMSGNGTNDGNIVTGGTLALMGGGNLTNNGKLYSATGVIDASGNLTNSGEVLASNINVGGTLTNKSGGLVRADGDLMVEANAITNEAGGEIGSGSGSVTFANVGGDITNEGLISAATTASLGATGTFLNSGTVQSDGTQTYNVASLTNSGTLNSSSGEIDASATTGGLTNSAGGEILAGTVKSGGTLSNSGLIETDGALSVQVATGGLVNNTGGEIGSQTGAVELDVTGTINNAGFVSAATTGDFTSTGATTNSGTVSTADNQTYSVASLTNSGTLNSSSGEIDASATTGGLTNSAGGEILADTVKSGGTLDNSGLIETDGDLSVQVAAGGLVNNAGGEIGSQTDAVELDVTGTINNAGLVSAATTGDFTSTGATTNSGTVSTADNQTYSVASLTNSGTLNSSSGEIDASATTGGLTNSAGGEILADTVKSGGTLDNSGLIETDGDLSVQVAAGGLVNNAGGEIGSQTGAVELDVTGTINNAGFVSAATTGDFTSTGATTNSGTVSTTGDQTYDVASFNNSGTLHSAGGEVDASATTGGLTNNAGGEILAGTVKSGGTLDNSGLIETDGDLSVQVAAGGLVNNAGGEIGSQTGAVELDVTGTINNAGFVSAATTGDFTSTDATTNSGTVSTTGDQTYDVASLNNSGTLFSSGGSISASNTTGDVDVENSGQLLASSVSTDGMLTNEIGGIINSTGNLNVSASQLTNESGGEIGTDAGSVTLGISGDTTNAGLIAASTTVTANSTTGTFDNQTGGVVSAGSDVDLNVAGVTNDGTINSDSGAIDSSSDLTNDSNGQLLAANVISVGNITNRGLISNDSGVAVEAVSLDNETAGEISSASGDATVMLTGTATTGNFANAGKVIAGNDAVIQLDGTLDNDGGEIVASQNLTVRGKNLGTNAASVTNNSGIIQATAGDVTIDADSVTNKRSVPVTLTTNTVVSGSVTTETETIDEANSPPAGQILAGGNINIAVANTGGVLENSDSLIFADGNMNLSGDTLNNTGTVLTETVTPPGTTSPINSESFIKAGGMIAKTFTTENDDGVIEDSASDSAPLVMRTAAVPNAFDDTLTGATIPTQTLTNAPDPTQILTDAPDPTQTLTDASDPTQTLTNAPAPTDTLNSATIPPVPVLTQKSVALAAPTVGQPNFFDPNDGRFTDLPLFFSSDYFFSRVQGLSPEERNRLIGDDYQLLRQLLEQLEIEKELQLFDPGYTDPNKLIEALYLDVKRIIAQETGSLTLIPNVVLSEEQVTILRERITWLIKAKAKVIEKVQDKKDPNNKAKEKTNVKLFDINAPSLYIDDNGELVSTDVNNITLSGEKAAE